MYMKKSLPPAHTNTHKHTPNCYDDRSDVQLCSAYDDQTHCDATGKQAVA